MEEIDIDHLLDEGLPDDLRERKKTHNYEEKSKLVLEGLLIDTYVCEFPVRTLNVFLALQKRAKIILKYCLKDGSK